VRSASEGLDFLLGKGKFENKPQPGIIFLDINMPGMTGWDFIAKYNELSDDIHEKAVVAMLTTTDNPDDRLRASGIPAVIEYVHKPLTAEVFRKVMNENFN
jgi:CheY-like chemotaxis protein